MGYGERPGQAPRCHGIDSPAPTVVPSGTHALVEPFILPHRQFDQMDTDPIAAFRASLALMESLFEVRP